MACYGCDYLYHILSEGFVEAGGDVGWLDGEAQNVPNKLKRLIDLNFDLAYNPWIY